MTNANGTLGSKRASWILWVAAAALITYGSLYPFNFSGDTASARIQQLFADWTLYTSKGDVLGNVALFVPLGLATYWVSGRSARILALVALGVAVAFGLQVLQVFLPTRSAAMADVLWNSVGIFIGIVLAYGLARFTWIRTVLATPREWLALGLVMVWCLLQLLPLVPSLDFEQIKENLKPLLFDRAFELAPAAKAFADIVLIAALLGLVFNRTLSVLICGLVLIGVVLGKIISIQSSLSSPQLLGFGIGFLAAIALISFDIRARTALALTLGVLAYLIDSALPLNLNSESSGFGWVPFGGFLQGSMLINAKSLLSMIFTFGSFVFLLSERSGKAMGAAIVLGVLVLVIEIAQTWIQGRTGEITPVLIVIAIGIALQWSQRLFDGRARVEKHVVSVHEKRRSRESSKEIATDINSRGAERRLLYQLGITALLMAGAIYIALRLPGMPYNLRELFLWDGAFVFLVIFSLAVLWIGFGAKRVATWVARSKYPTLALIAGCIGVALCSLLLLAFSVTDESLDDICGSNNLHWFVVNKSIWGETARGIFTALPAELVGFFERPVRFTALYTPLTLCLVLLFLGFDRSARRIFSMRHLIPIALVSLALFLICKAIAFDWSSTDNLNELIARNGPLGLPGGVYLYALLVAGCAHAVFASTFARMNFTARLILMGTTLIAIPVSWWLINAGLEQRVEKYELIFSGVQFLLGPDRTTTLSQAMLFARWCVVYLGGVFVIALGAHFAPAPLMTLFRGARGASKLAPVQR